MLKSLSKFKSQNKDKIKVPRTVQDTIPIDTIYKDGIFRYGKRYSKCFKFLDINYSDASTADKESILLGYGEMLNSLDTSCTLKVTISNRKVDPNEISKSILINHIHPELKDLSESYNELILDNLSKSDNLIQEKYLTITVFKKSIDEARSFFSRVSLELMSHFNKIGSNCVELNAIERLKIFHDFYRDAKEPFELDINDSARKGHSFKDTIVPRMAVYENNCFHFENKYGRVLYLENYPKFLKDRFVSEICGLNKNLMYSMDILPIPTDEAAKEMEKKLLSVNTNITNWQRRQNAYYNFSAAVPYDMVLQRTECTEVMDDLTIRDQKMFLCNISIVLLANTKQELDEDTEAIKSLARSYSCELSILYFASRQLDGLVTTLPFGVNKLEIFRTLLTESVSAFIPFRAQEILDEGGVWYGQNKLTNNLIICNKEKLQNPNSFILGVPGSGKSFLAKEEIEFYALSTNDDIIICDPESEYDGIVEKLGGEVIQIAVGSKDHINAMDMAEGYGDSGNPIGDKSQFIMSLFEQLDKNKHDITPIERSIIDRCVALVYKEAEETGQVPTLKTLRNMLSKQSEPEAKSLAIKIELFTEGSLDVFAHETNVDVDNRIISYNIFNLGQQLKTIGLLVITDAMINRVNENWRKGKRTHVFIDEVHVIFENEESALFFSSAWRQFRKRDAYPTGITQNVSYLLASEQGTYMLSNSLFIVMLNQSANDGEKLAELLKISKEQMSYITNAQSGCGLIRCGSVLVPFVNRIPEDNLIYKLNTTKPSDRKEALKQKGSL